NPVGVALTGATGFTGFGILQPKGIAIDEIGNALVVNANSGGAGTGSLTRVTGTLASAVQLTNKGIDDGYGVATDNQYGDIWIVSRGTNSITRLDNSGAQSGVSPFGTGLTDGGPNWIAVGTDPSSFGDGLEPFPVSVYVSNFPSSVGPPPASKLAGFHSDTSNTALTGSPFSTGDADFILSNGVAVDDLDNVWVTSLANHVAEFNSAGVLQGVFTDVGGMNGPSGIAMDGSGKPWMTNLGDLSHSAHGK